MSEARPGRPGSDNCDSHFENLASTGRYSTARGTDQFDRL